MNSYLDIATNILRTTRRPMTAKAILKQAYTLGIAPVHIYGKTQHKTLQARLSEDILKYRENSLFFRTKPGYFFLREFITDTSIPIEFRQPIVARRRIRDIFKGPALSVDREEVAKLLRCNEFASTEILNTIIKKSIYHYTEPKKNSSKNALIWAISALTRNGKILSYRNGRYRDERDLFSNKRSIAFSSLVSEYNYTLFDEGSLGIVDTAFLSLAIDLDFPMPESFTSKTSFKKCFRFLTWQKEAPKKTDLIAFIEVEAPEWFEPTSSKLSLNEIRWLDLQTPPNNWNDFDPYSRTILSFYFPSVVSYAQT